MAESDDDSSSGKNERVGYRRPPEATRFKKGHSGNPDGRPRKPRDEREIAARVLTEKQRLNRPKGEKVLHSTLEVIVTTLKQKAASGDASAANYLQDFSKRHGRQQSVGKVGYLVIPERLTREEWEAKYAPKDDPPPEHEDFDE